MCRRGGCRLGWGVSITASPINLAAALGTSVLNLSVSPPGGAVTIYLPDRTVVVDGGGALCRFAVDDTGAG